MHILPQEFKNFKDILQEVSLWMTCENTGLEGAKKTKINTSYVFAYNDRSLTFQGNFGKIEARK